MGLNASLDPIWLPNNGVALRYDVMDIRCLKADCGRVPGPGQSRVKRRFYNQMIQPGLFVLEPERERKDATVNLLVTWDASQSGTLVSLAVHSPFSAASTRDSVHLYWTEDLLHPAETFEPEPEPQPDEEPEELPGYDEDHPDESTDTGTG